MSLRIGGLFEGYGGLTRAVQLALGGGELAWYSEFEPATEKNPRPTQAAARLLAYRHPGVPNLGDITAVDWSMVEPVDVLCGGFPCQDISPAGQRAGLRPGSRSGLWAQFAYAIDRLRPRLVVVENVPGLLTARGAEPTAELLAAWAERDRCDRIIRLLNSKHARAVRDGKEFHVRQHATDRHRLLGRRRRAVAAVRRADAGIVRAVGTVLGDLARLGYDAVWHCVSAADIGAPHKRLRVFIVAYPEGHPRRVEHRDGGGAGGGSWLSGAGALLPTPRTSDTNGAGRHGTGGEDLRTVVSQLLPTPTGRDGKGANQRGDETCLHGALLPTPRATDGTKGGPNQAVRPSLDGITGWGKYEPAIRRWEAVTGRPAPCPTEANSKGGRRLAAPFGEWMMGLPAGHVTDPAVGLTRNEQLRLIGNGVVPLQGAAGVRWCLDMATATPHPAQTIDRRVAVG